VTPDRADRWFEGLYASAGDDLERIPWAQLAPRPALVGWLDRHPPAAGARALVVACGLGDDAEELARRGCAVEAFDLSPTAIATARRRFPDSAVGYRVADLFELPEGWRARFEIVVEVMTVQSIAPEWHRDAIAAIAACVAPRGRLLMRAAVRAEDEPADSRPWPLAPSELRWFEDEGLEEVARCVDGFFVNVDYRRARAVATRQRAR
jgi:SAM-dependent methyltransferase